MTTTRRGDAAVMRHPTSDGLAHSAAAVVDELRDLAASDDIVRTLRRSAELATEVARWRRPVPLVDALDRATGCGTLVGVLSIELLGAIRHPAAAESLAATLSSRDRLVRRHAAWRLRHQQPTPLAVAPLLDLLVTGGIDTMHAHRTLRRWAASDTSIVDRVVGRLAVTGEGRQRARLLDLIGVIDDARTDALLARIAADGCESGSARIAATGAASARRSASMARVLEQAARAQDEVGAHATLALRQMDPSEAPRSSRCAGLRIAQLTMAAGVDRELSLGGRADVGGVASLLVSLAGALADRPGIEHVLTIGRGTVTDALRHPPVSDDGGTSFATIVVGDEGRPVPSVEDLWEHLPAIERGVAHAIAAGGGVDLLHLRMADAGTLAGAATARAAGLTTCFSLAPDPHNVLAALRARGGADHDAVVRLSTESHVWFRARLVERLARESDRIAHFPRTGSLGALMSTEHRSRVPQRATVVAEGIDVELIRKAQATDTSPLRTSTPFDVLADLAASIPCDRRDLPLLVSVGRLHPVKGMDRIVHAWADAPALHAGCTLVIVGGDLAAPSAVERSVLAAIDRLVPVDDERRRGLVLLGGRPHADVARLLVAAASGRAGCWSPGGVYLDGAWKEEFGLAVLEALAAGLVVVAPSTGGPPTYVREGETGVLVDPDADLAAAIERAFALVDRPGRATCARRMVEAKYSVTTMAGHLADLYRPVTLP